MSRHSIPGYTYIMLLCTMILSTCGDGPDDIVFDNPLDSDNSEQIPEVLDVRQLTTSSSSDSTPSWSPDGSRIAYSSSPPGGIPQIWSIAVTGGTPTQLTNYEYGASDPEYSPDGRRILLRTRENMDSSLVGLWSIPASGGPRTKVFKGAWGNDYSGSWSPDGSEIVFISERGASGPGGQNIWIVSSDGSGNGLRQLTSGNPGDCEPDWSPDGTTIIFYSSIRSGNHDLWTIPATGGTPTNFTNTPDWQEAHPAYSTDGKWVAFTSDRSGMPGTWVMPATGGEQTLIVDYTETVSSPTWNPDDTMIAFEIGTSDDRDIWIVSMGTQ